VIRAIKSGLAFRLTLLCLMAMLLVVQDVAAQRKRNRRKRVVRSRPAAITKLTIVQESEVSEGVRYAEFKSNGRTPVDIHVVYVDRTVAANAIRIVKGEDKYDGKESVVNMSKRYTEQTNSSVLALVNANFWRAVRNTAIGPCVVDGEVVEMLPYKGWTSAFVDVRNRITIDTFKLKATIRYKGSTRTVTSVNRRLDSSGIVVYNAYAGDIVPYINTSEIEREFREAMKDSVFMDRDSTEMELTQQLLRTEIVQAKREASTEHPLTKISLRYLRTPSVNEPLICRVIAVDTGSVAMPLRGCIVSLPTKWELDSIPKQGDTITLHFSTNVSTDTKFMNAVCGTPRLVRNGVAKHEAQKEGSTGSRFIKHQLSRTALGTDKSGNKILLVAIEPPQGSQGTTGATLDQMAQIMKLLGAYQAMNLDGGGSAGMVVNDDHMFFEGVDPDTRRVSVGIAVVKLSHVLRSLR